MEEELPSASDVAKADNIELQEITENAVRSTENLIAQLDDQKSVSFLNSETTQNMTMAFEKTSRIGLKG